MSKSRRRYGGYLVHLGITAMYLGFVGTVWSTTKEVGMAKGDSVEIAGYTLQYLGSRTCPGSSGCTQEQQLDTGKRRLLADLQVYENGVSVAQLHPAKFSYQRSDGMTTTEVALRRSLGVDLYVVLGNVEPNTDRAHLQIHANPLVSWIWLGALVLVLGASLALWPEVSLGRLGAWSLLRPATTTQPIARLMPDKGWLVWLERHRNPVTTTAMLAVSLGLATKVSVATVLLFWAFVLLVLVLYQLWSSIKVFGRQSRLTLNEALELAAPKHDEERKQSLLRGLKDLEYERGLGKLTDEDYQSLSQRYRSEAKELLKKLDASEEQLRQRLLEAVAKRMAEKS
jgi:hypothetical protein